MAIISALETLEHVKTYITKGSVHMTVKELQKEVDETIKKLNEYQAQLEHDEILIGEYEEFGGFYD